MINLKRMNFKKIVVFLILLAVAETVFCLAFLAKRRNSSPIQVKVVPVVKLPVPKMFFSFSSPTLIINKESEIKIMIDTRGKIITGADAVVKYDPNLLSIKKVVPGKLFPYYPILKIKKDKGRVEITGTIVSPDQQSFNGAGELASLLVEPLTEGEISLSFDFTSGKTNDSNLAEKGTGNDILEEVGTANFSLKR